MSISTEAPGAPADWEFALVFSPANLWTDADKEFFEVMFDEGFAESAGNSGDLSKFADEITDNFQGWMLGILTAVLEGNEIPRVDHAFYGECKKIAQEWVVDHDAIMRRAGKDAYLTQFKELLRTTLQPMAVEIMKRNVDHWNSETPLDE